MPEQWAGHRVFHYKKLKKYVPPTFPRQAQRVILPKPDFVDGEPEYKVAEVLSEKKVGKKTYFLVHWEGYAPEEDTWEPEDNLGKAREVINKFRSRGRGPGEGGHNVRNRLSATRWQVTPRILPVPTTPPITFHEPRYVNTIKLFGHRPGTGPRKAPSHQMDRAYSEVLRNTAVGLNKDPKLRWELPINEISALGRELKHSSIGRMLVDHQATITTPTSGI